MLLSKNDTTADVTGIENNSLSNVPICTVAGLLHTSQGPKIGIFNQYAYVGKGNTIHSTNQMAFFGMHIDATPRVLGGKQELITAEGIHIPPFYQRWFGLYGHV